MHIFSLLRRKKVTDKIYEQPTQVHSLWIIDTQLTHFSSVYRIADTTLSSQWEYLFTLSKQNNKLPFLFYWLTFLSISIYLSLLLAVLLAIIAYTMGNYSVAHFHSMRVSQWRRYKSPWAKVLEYLFFPSPLSLFLCIYLKWCHYFCVFFCTGEPHLAN